MSAPATGGVGNDPDAAGALTHEGMSQKNFRVVVTWLLAMALLAPGIVARTVHNGLAPTEGLMHVDVTYTEEQNIIERTNNPRTAEEWEVSNFRFHANATFEQRVMMQTLADGKVNFYPVMSAKQIFSGGVSYNGELKRTVSDETHRPIVEEKSGISFAGVLSDDSIADVPDDNAAGIRFGIQADMSGGCQGKRTNYTYGNEKKIQTTELNSCGISDELHEAVRITREPLNLDLRQKSADKEFVHYAAQFHVTSCNLNPQYCVELKAAEAAANSSGGPNSEATSDNWIGGTTTGSVTAGFKINLTMFKELKVDGTWKRYLQMAASVTPLARSRAALEENRSRSVETADRLREVLSGGVWVSRVTPALKPGVVA